MPLNNPDDTTGMASEYMSSALPWVTSSNFTTTPTRYKFPKVSRFIQVRNHGPGELALGFTTNGVNGSNRFVVPPGEMFESELRLREIYVRALSTTSSGSVLAGLTTAPSKYMPVLTGSINGTSMWEGVG